MLLKECCFKDKEHFLYMLGILTQIHHCLLGSLLVIGTEKTRMDGWMDDSDTRLIIQCKGGEVVEGQVNI